MTLLNWLKSVFLSDDDFKPRVRKESKKVDDTSEQKESKPKVIDKENDSFTGILRWGKGCGFTNIRFDVR
mgnify:CR=1 FL=1